jgi:hypothetical protein
VYRIHLAEKLLQYYYNKLSSAFKKCIISTLTSVKLGFKNFLIFVKKSGHQESTEGYFNFGCMMFRLENQNLYQWRWAVTLGLIVTPA